MLEDIDDVTLGANGEDYAAMDYVNLFQMCQINKNKCQRWKKRW